MQDTSTNNPSTSVFIAQSQAALSVWVSLIILHFIAFFFFITFCMPFNRSDTAQVTSSEDSQVQVKSWKQIVFNATHNVTLEKVVDFLTA